MRINRVNFYAPCLRSEKYACLTDAHVVATIFASCMTEHLFLFLYFLHFFQFLSILFFLVL